MAAGGAALGSIAGRFSRRLDRLSDHGFALIVSVPSLVLLALVVLPPIVAVFAFSLFRIELAKDDRTSFVGLANFLTRIPADQVVVDSIARTVLLAAAITAVTLPLALVAALAMNRRFRGDSLFFIVLLIPWAISSIVTGIFWRLIFDVRFGIVNGILVGFGFIQTPINWLEDTRLALAIAVVATAWRSVPLLALLLLAALRTIPASLYRAARMDGATAWQAFRFITIPAIRPTLLLVGILQVIIGLQSFDIVYSLTGGGPGRDTYVLIYAIYDTAFRSLSFGYASAITVVLFGLIALCSLLLLATQTRRHRRAAPGPRDDENDLLATTIHSRSGGIPGRNVTEGLRSTTVTVAARGEPEILRSRWHLPAWIGSALFGLGVALLFVFFLAPVVWILIASLQPTSAFGDLPPHLTTNLWLDGYQQIMASHNWQGSLVVSLLTATVTMVLVIAIASPAAYSLARLRIRGRRLILATLIFTQMVPAVVMAIPVLRIFQILRLTDTVQALVIVNVAFWLPLIVWLLRNFFADVPVAIENAARIDGASRLGTLFRVTIPAARPGIAAAAILILIGTWNEFLFAVVLGNHNAVAITRRIIALSTNDFYGDRGFEVPPPNDLAAAGLISVLPCLLLVALFHRRIINGLTEGLLKG